MKPTNKQLSTSIQQWTNRVERRHPPNIDYNSELKDWLQHVIFEAEKNNDSKKKDQFLNLLKDLNTV
jgi:hypothetical protein